MATTSSRTDLATRLRTAIVRTNRRLRQQGGAGLSPTLSAALGTIGRHGPLTPSELADRERVQRPTATRLLARLEAPGYVTRTPDPEDGRSSLVALTPAGRALLEQTRNRKDAYLARRLRTLSAEERATLRRAADILERMLDEGAGDDARGPRT
jgi:DNA-binding MarR family transcriptional regulator